MSLESARKVLTAEREALEGLLAHLRFNPVAPATGPSGGSRWVERNWDDGD